MTPGLCPDDKEETILEEKEKKQGKGTIVALIALIVVLFVGIKLVFYGIGVMIPQEELKGSSSQSQSQEETSSQQEQTQQAPAFCPYCGQELFEGFQWGQFCPYCGEKVEQG